MSLATWKQEFYPEPARLVYERDAIAHSLRKWRGLTQDNLKRHGLENHIDEIQDEDDCSFPVTSETCALCQVHKAHISPFSCGQCPLAAVHGGQPCDERTGTESMSPYVAFIVHHEAGPMIELLENALARQQK